MNEEQSKLTAAQAIEIVTQVFAKTQGTLQDHMMMQASLRLLTELTKPVEEAVTSS